MDTHADDLAALVRALDLRDAIHVGHSTGGGEVVRHLGRHATDRASRAVLIGAVPPLMLKTQDNPEGTLREAFDDIRKACWRTAPSSTGRFLVLVLHGDDDQIVPIGASALKSARLLEEGISKVYGGAPHGMAATHADQVNAERDSNPHPQARSPSRAQAVTRSRVALLCAERGAAWTGRIAGTDADGTRRHLRPLGGPRHTTKGSRSVRIEGHPGPLDSSSITRVVVHSDLRRIADLACPRERIDRLHAAPRQRLRAPDRLPHARAIRLDGGLIALGSAIS